VLDIIYSKKHAMFDVPMADSSLLEQKVICLSNLKLEAAGSSESFETTCQICLLFVCFLGVTTLLVVFFTVP